MKRPVASLALGLMLTATAWAAAPVAGARGPVSLPLDLAVERDPLGQGGTLHLFGENGRNQALVVGVDAAPNCGPIPIELAVAPVVSGGSVFALGRDGALWQFGKGLPKAVEQTRTGALAMLPSAALPAILYPDKLRLPSGAEVSLPFPAEGGASVETGWWVRSGSSCALLKPDGILAWQWEQQNLHPLCAVASGKSLFTGTSEGWLVALNQTTGKSRWRYRCGGAVVALQPLASGDLLLLSSDHTARRITAEGDLVWQCRLSARPAAGLFQAAGRWLVSELGGRSVALLDEKNGKPLWGWTAPAGEILRAPAIVSSSLGEFACVLVSTGDLHQTLWLLPLPAAAKKETSP